MNRIKKFLLNDLLKVTPGFGRRVMGICIIEILTGFFTSFLVNVNLGTDPCTFLNLHISEALGISFGNQQLLLNTILFLIVIALSRFRYIGVGSLANMVLIGYSTDFFRWLWSRTLPEGIFLSNPGKIFFFVFGFIGFILCAAIYMNYDMGMSPYDATPCIIGEHLKRIPFTIIRMCWDFGMIGIGCLVGGVPPVGTLILAVALGPTISLIGRLMNFMKHPRRRAALEH